MFKKKETENVISEETTKKGHPVLKTLAVVGAAGAAILGGIALIGKSSNDAANYDYNEEDDIDDTVVPFERTDEPTENI